MEFVSSKNLKFNLVEFENKFVGIIKTLTLPFKRIYLIQCFKMAPSQSCDY